MAILSGRYGKVSYDPTGTGTPAEIVSINSWTMNQKTDRIDVTCFGATNRVYVPGMKDVSGDFEGFWDSSELTLWEAIDAPTPGKLELTPNRNEATFKWSGLAYLDGTIDVAVNDAPKTTGTWSAAGPWTMTTA